MKKIGLGLISSFMLTCQVLAQTPTPIQRKHNTPSTEPIIVYPTQKNTSTEIPSYCADKLRVFRGVLVFNENFGYSVDFNRPLCFTDGKEVFKINRVILIIWHPNHESYMKQTSNQRVRLVINNFKMLKLNNNIELVANNFLIRDDFD